MWPEIRVLFKYPASGWIIFRHNFSIEIKAFNKAERYDWKRTGAR